MRNTECYVVYRNRERYLRGKNLSDSDLDAGNSPHSEQEGDTPARQDLPIVDQRLVALC